MRLRRAALREEAGGAEQRGEAGAEREMRAVDDDRSGSGSAPAVGPDGSTRCSKLKFDRVVQEHQRDQHAGERHRGGRGFAAPGDRDGGGGERDEA